MLDLVRRAAGERAILVTDATLAAGAPAGDYEMAGVRIVRGEDGSARTADGRLAGSTLTLDAAVRNWARLTGASLAEALMAANEVPAAATGLNAGALRPGAAADLVLLNRGGNVVRTMAGTLGSVGTTDAKRIRPTMTARAIRRMIAAGEATKGDPMFKTIVWATDGSESADTALPFVAALAREQGASLVVAHAIESFATSRSAGLPVFADEEEMKAKIEGQVEQLRSDGFVVDTTIVHAGGIRPAQLIAEAAKDAGADLIVVGTRGHTPLGGLMLGSVTQRLLHIAPCPVLAIPAGAHGAEPEAAAAEAAGASS